MGRLKHYDKTARLGTWISLGNENMVRLLELDSSKWNFDFDLTKYNVAYNKCGGLVAVYGKGIARMENAIVLLSSSGQKHAVAPKIKLNDAHEVLFMCWNQVQDHLIVVLNDQTVRFFNYKGELASVDLKLDTNPLLFASTGSGFAGVTSFVGEAPAALYLVHFNERDGYTLRSVTLPSPFQKIVPTTSLLAIPGKHTDNGFPEVLLPCTASPIFSGIYRCVFTPLPRVVDLKLSIAGGTVKKMALSPGGHSLAFTMEDGSLYFANRNLEEVLKSTERLEGCTDVAWCGEKCVACQLSSVAGEFEGDSSTSIMIVNPEDPSFFDYIYDLPADLIMLPECDGIRLLSGDSFYQLLHTVTEEGRRVFSVGSRAMSAVLLSAFDEFMSGGATTAVASIQEMRERSEDLSEAINDCVGAAAAEFDYEQQKRLLRIGAFGKAFCPTYDSDNFVNICRRIRARNTLASSSAGIVLSHQELIDLGDDRLLRRLVQGNHHQIAHAVCSALELKTDGIVLDWAMTKLTHVMTGRPGTDQERSLAKKIVLKIGRTGSLTSFAELARLANERGYRAAAMVFLEAEPNALRQVPMLLTIGEAEAALKQAVLANNADLVFTVIAHLLDSKGARATAIISNYPEARSILLEYINVSESHREVMTGFFHQHPECQTVLNLQTYFQEESRMRKGFSTARNIADVNWEMLQECKCSATQSLIISARKEAEKSSGSNAPTAGASFSPNTQSAPQAAMNEKFLRLHLSVIQDQTRLMREFGDSRFLTASVTDMVRFSLEHGRESVAAKLKTDYNIPERVYQWCMLTAYAQTGQWDLIDDLGGVSSRTQPLINGEAFITTLLSFGRPQQARQYIPRVSRIEVRMEYYVQCGDWLTAAMDCRRNGENGLMGQLRDRAKGDAEILQQLDQGWNTQQETTVKFPKLFAS